MKKRIRPSILVLIFSAVGVATSFAQTPKQRPFATGETLIYEAKISKIINGIPVGDLTFTVENGDDPNSLTIKAEARSKGTLLKIAHYSFLYEYASSIDGNRFRIEHTDRKTTEKERVRTGAADFNYSEKRVTYVETDPKEPMKPPRKIASDIEEQTQDVVSGIYALRMLPLAVGKKFDLTVSDSGLVYDVPVRVTAREVQRTAIGRVWCFRVEPDIFGPGHMIEDKGTMAIWITDDARRIPVRSRIDIDFGKVEIRLKSVSNSTSGATTTAQNK